MLVFHWEILMVHVVMAPELLSCGAFGGASLCVFFMLANLIVQFLILFLFFFYIEMLKKKISGKGILCESNATCTTIKAKLKKRRRFIPPDGLHACFRWQKYQSLTSGASWLRSGLSASWRTLCSFFGIIRLLNAPARWQQSLNPRNQCQADVIHLCPEGSPLLLVIAVATSLE